MRFGQLIHSHRTAACREQWEEWPSSWNNPGKDIEWARRCHRARLHATRWVGLPCLPGCPDHTAAPAGRMLHLFSQSYNSHTRHSTGLSCDWRALLLLLLGLPAGTPVREDALCLAQQLLQENPRLVDEGEVACVGHYVDLHASQATS